MVYRISGYTLLEKDSIEIMANDSVRKMIHSGSGLYTFPYGKIMETVRATKGYKLSWNTYWRRGKTKLKKMIYTNKSKPSLIVELICEAEYRVGEMKRKIVIYKRQDNEKVYARNKEEFETKFQRN